MAPISTSARPVGASSAGSNGAGADYVRVGKHLLAGGLAGAVSRTVVSPLERIKILFQVRRRRRQGGSV